MIPAESSSTPLPQRQSLPPLLQRYERWTVFFFLFSCCYHAFCYFVLHAHAHFIYPFSLNHRDRFADFTVFTDKYAAYHTAAFYSTGMMIIYPAPTWPIFNLFFKLAAPHEVFAAVTACVLAFAIPAALFGRSLVQRGITTGRVVVFVTLLCLLSWPVDLLVDGANMEVAVWLAMVVGMWAYATGRSWTAAIFFGLAASLKLFPFVFLTLFLSRRYFGQLIAGAAAFGLATWAALSFSGPTTAIAFRGFLDGMQFAKDIYFTYWRVGEQGVDHSMFASIKFLLIVLRGHSTHGFTGWLRGYEALTAVGGTLLYFLVIRKMPLLNQVLTLSIVCIYFTPFSGDGTLIHLYYPLAMLFFLAIKAWREGVKIPGLALLLNCMVVCLSMESFLMLPNRHFPDGLRLIGFAHSIVLGILLIASLRYPMGPPLSEELGETVLSRPVVAWARRPATA